MPLHYLSETVVYLHCSVFYIFIHLYTKYSLTIFYIFFNLFYLQFCLIKINLILSNSFFSHLHLRYFLTNFITIVLVKFFYNIGLIFCIIFIYFCIYFITDKNLSIFCKYLFKYLLNNYVPFLVLKKAQRTNFR